MHIKKENVREKEPETFALFRRNRGEPWSDYYERLATLPAVAGSVENAPAKPPNRQRPGATIFYGGKPRIRSEELASPQFYPPGGGICGDLSVAGSGAEERLERHYQKIQEQSTADKRRTRISQTIENVLQEVAKNLDPEGHLNEAVAVEGKEQTLFLATLASLSLE